MRGMRALTEVNGPPRVACLVMIPNQGSIWLIHDEPTGVNWKLTCGFAASQALTSGVGGQGVQHDMDLFTGIRVDGAFDKGEKLDRAVRRGWQSAKTSPMPVFNA